MKRMSYHQIACVVILGLFACTCATPLWAEDAPLKAKVEAFYQKFNQALESKNFDSLKTFYSENYQVMGGMGTDRNAVLEGTKKLFEQYDQLRNTIKVDSVQKVDSNVQVFGSGQLEVKKKGETQWTTLLNEGFIELLKEVENSYEIVTTGMIDLSRMKNIQGNVYTEKNIGFSVSAPEGWSIYPFTIPHMKDGIMFVMPDGHSPGFFGYMQIPYNLGVKQAIEGDDAMMKKIMKSFTLEKSGPVTVNGLEGYESLTRYASGAGEEQTRHRVYLSGGGLLYVFIVNAPTNQWDAVKDDLMKIVNTFSLSADAKKSGAARLREANATGEIMDRIYTNQELGCQIAAPKGWSIESTPLGSFKVSISMKPAQGDSLVRLLAMDTKGMIELKDIFDQELNSIKSITEDFALLEEAKDIELAGTTGRVATSRFSLEGLGTMQRRSVMAVKNNVLYMILCDAIPPEKATELNASFDAIIQSFTVN